MKTIMNLRASHKIVLWVALTVTYYIISSQIGIYICNKQPNESISNIITVLATGVIVAYMAKTTTEKAVNKKYNTKETIATSDLCDSDTESKPI